MIPEAATLAKRNVVMPPRTQSGMDVKNAAICSGTTSSGSSCSSIIISSGSGGEVGTHVVGYDTRKTIGRTCVIRAAIAEKKWKKSK